MILLIAFEIQDERASREAEESLNMRLKGEITQLKLRLLESERDNTDLRHKSELVSLFV